MEKILLITRGAPGSGKTTFLKDIGLYSNAISPDQIRCDLGGIQTMPNGIETRGAFDEREVWNKVKEEVATRMKKGWPVIIDATFKKRRDFTTPLKQAKLYRYKTIVIDFTNVPKQVALFQNSQRNGWKLVPEDVIIRAYKNFRQEKLPTEIKCISHMNFADTLLCKQLQECAEMNFGV